MVRLFLRRRLTSPMRQIRPFWLQFHSCRAVGRDDADPEQQAAIKYRPLYYYARRGNIEAMRVILRNSAKVDPTPDIPSYTPLHAAAEHNLEAVKLPKTKNFVPDPRI
jgi:ankyrin repeat protein